MMEIAVANLWFLHDLIWQLLMLELISVRNLRASPANFNNPPSRTWLAAIPRSVIDNDTKTNNK
jgi:hypothetical protein